MKRKVTIITGPIGSGKSTVLSILSELGYETTDLDKISNQILSSNESYEFLIKNFPNSIKDGKVVKENIAEIVFSNKEKLKQLEEFLHPKILNQLNEIIKKSEGHLFVEVSAPKKMYKDFNTIVIWASKNERVKRLISRGMNREDIGNRIETQLNDEWWLSLGEVIKNDDKEHLKEKIINLISNHE
tara:strand:- start:229 stop:786 length:558 start_codon:yes stop_codon:yes gene_type:complete